MRAGLDASEEQPQGAALPLVRQQREAALQGAPHGARAEKVRVVVACAARLQLEGLGQAKQCLPVPGTPRGLQAPESDDAPVLDLPKDRAEARLRVGPLA